jgi:hypothetical protein
MFCSRCGQQVPDNSASCPSCGNALSGPGPAGMPPLQPQPYGPPPGQYQEQVPNYLVFSILVTIFCCLPTGIVAIVYSAQVSSKQAAGDIAGAMAASSTAKTWCWVSFGLGLVAGLISFIFSALMAAGGAMSMR